MTTYFHAVFMVLQIICLLFVTYQGHWEGIPICFGFALATVFAAMMDHKRLYPWSNVAA